MKFPDPLIKGRLIKRYKRFLADVELDDGTIVTAHCANSGSMLSVQDAGATLWLSPAKNPKRKLRYTWEMIKIGNTLVGIHTHHANTLVEEAVRDGAISELSEYSSIRREVKYGTNSRIDLLLESPSLPTCYVEVKSVTLKREAAPKGTVEFPDAVTLRGHKHLRELSKIAKQGLRAVTVYLVQREDAKRFSIARDIDPAYGENLDLAMTAGVEILCYGCILSPSEITVGSAIPLGF
jgi:sugar fermentation stimulation protein A